MSFTGDPFADWVDEQIKTRQTAYGATQRNPNRSNIFLIRMLG